MEVISKQGRRFQLTLNQVEHYDIVKEYLMSRKSFKYLLSCKETAPTTGHEHIHIYVYFTNAVRLSQTKVKNAHTEVCRGSNEQNIKYIRKNGDIIDEIGQQPEWIMGWTAIDVGLQLPSTATPGTAGNKFSLTTRLKRNLNSGDRVVAILQSRQPTTAQAQVVFTCQYWTCSN